MTADGCLRFRLWYPGLGLNFADVWMDGVWREVLLGGVELFGGV